MNTQSLYEASKALGDLLDETVHLHQMLHAVISKAHDDELEREAQQAKIRWLSEQKRGA